MRSFIKSHKKSNSLDSSPSRSQSDKESGRSSYEYGIHPQAPISKRPVLDKGPPQSLSFESFHKLSNKNKIFSTKIFKKPGGHASKTGEPCTTPVSPHVPTFRNLSSPETPHNSHFVRHVQEESKEFTTIKGTRTHEWGEAKEKSSSVIILNRSSTSSDASSEITESGFGSHVKLQRGSVSSATSSCIDENQRASFDFQAGAITPLVKLDDLSEVQEKHPYFSLRSHGNKAKNRQVRIHSHEDFLSLEKNSSVNLGFLDGGPGASNRLQNLSSLNNTDDSLHCVAEDPSKTRFQAQKDSTPNQHLLGLGIDAKNSAQGEVSSLSSTDEREQSVITNDRSFEEGDENRASSIGLSTTKHSASEHSENDFEIESECGEDYSDDSSKFSFEIGGVNGRTSSVKYYSKPDPVPHVYVDDIYEDDDFDEDMNCFDEEEDQEFGAEFRKKDVNASGRSGFSNLKETNGFSTITDAISSDEEAEQPNRGEIKGYNDLFDISDDELDTNTSLHQEKEANDDMSYFSDDEALPLKDDISQDFQASNLKSYGDIFNLSDEESCLSSKEALANTNESISGQTKTFAEIKKAEALKKPFGHKPLTEEKNIENSFSTSHSPKIPKPSSPRGSLSITPRSDPKSPSLDCTSLSLPPPSRSQVIKYHDLSSNLDYEVPGAMSNLFFIDESEEDQYNKKRQPDEHYLDEVNNLPEDFAFSDDDEYYLSASRSPEPNVRNSSFKKTHSFSEKPIGAVKERTPNNYKLELKDRVVTFFNGPYDNTIANASPHSPVAEEDKGIPVSTEERQTQGATGLDPIPVTPSNSFSRPNAYLSQSNGLSPIQESHSSVDNSPRIKSRLNNN
ncbi:LAQU0S14e01992g1_1 [Lachancea quebecensis]|uniref:LAQU0S14e01992g1_1 n=1 Tax=Lachancea quebecensis TaxID=1654605 RepID=A0A0P1KWG0_9SACH|nr:LAQU0S14e01992g1_1 [Lachancea quebecensis]